MLSSQSRTGGWIRRRGESGSDGCKGFESFMQSGSPGGVRACVGLAGGRRRVYFLPIFSGVGGPAARLDMTGGVLCALHASPSRTRIHGLRKTARI